MNQPATFDVNETSRLDTFLTKALQEPRNQVAHLIKNSNVTVDGKTVTKPGLKLKFNQEVLVSFPEAEITPAQEIDFDVEVLYEDDDILVINKPSNLTVHPAASVKEPTLVDWLKHKNIRLSTISGEERHGIVHRLDKGTSGVMVVAKNNEAHEKLSLQLQDRSMGRYYLAVISPLLKDEFTYIDKPIGRSSHNRLKMGVVEHGKTAQTLFKKLYPSRDESVELITCKLFTGRTHQIRVHLESISRHIEGDHLYALKSKKDKISRILLHAYLLYLVHPTTGETMQFCAPVANDMQTFINEQFNKDTINELILPNNFNRHFTDFIL
ncbi:MAG: RluA family pseudouridine synthase [Campylobacterota bacterium]|nr:RluA family pseudouridine synthase [Campylobacterota bacterium]